MRSNVTALICPQALSLTELTTARSVEIVSECWYETGERDGIWATSFASFYGVLSGGELRQTLAWFALRIQDGATSLVTSSPRQN